MNTQNHRYHNKKRILFLLKRNVGSGGYVGTGAGLTNSCKFLASALRRHDLVKDAHVVICNDANSIDRELVLFSEPDICIIEAFWVTPMKLSEIQAKHPSVRFIIRVHSNVPFIAHEGISIDWMIAYESIPNTAVAFNNLKTAGDFSGILSAPQYLPNVYENEFHPIKETRGVIDIGCFGAIRTLKNQLSQAIAALKFANTYGVLIRFHINGNRIEHSSVGVLKNIKALFKDTPHQLVEHNWMSHSDFLKIVRKMDIGLQVSFTESFNIISADFIYSGVPIIVSNEISWMNSEAKTSPTSIYEISNKIARVLKRKSMYLRKAQNSLRKYNVTSLAQWFHFLNK